MISRRIEYIRYCDVPGCYESESAAWETREECEAAALRDGWIKLTRNRWMCPGCKEKAERKQHAKVTQET
jgi:hypothetical protein